LGLGYMLYGYLLGDEHLRRVLSVRRCYMLRWVIRRHGIVRGLPCHAVAPSIRLLHRLLVARERQVRRPDLGAALVRHGGRVRRLGSL
jgi:hypothetical protein